MNTIRLTYSPYGNNKVLKVTAAQDGSEEVGDEAESVDFEPKVVEHSISPRFNEEDEF